MNDGNVNQIGSVLSNVIALAATPVRSWSCNFNIWSIKYIHARNEFVTVSESFWDPSPDKQR